MQAQIEQGEFDLAQGLQSALEVACGEHLVEQFARQRFAAVDVRRHLLQHVPFPAIVFHELRRQFDGVPFDAMDAGDAGFIDARQQVVQSVSGFVEQRRDIVVREGGRFAADRAGEIAVEVGNRRAQAGRCAPPGDGFVHPGAAALGFARIEVEVELADQRTVRCFDAEKAHVIVPDGRPVGLDADAKETGDDAEQAVEHFVFGEVLAHFLFGKGVACLQQFFRGVGNIPRLQCFQPQMGVREGAQFGQVVFGEWPRLGCQVAQEGAYLGYRGGHLGNHREVGVVGVAEQACFFVAQGEQAADERGVVQFRRTKFGGAGGVGAIHRRTQSAAVGVLHDRQVGRHVQGEFPAAGRRCVGICRGFTGSLQNIFRDADDLGGIGDVLGKGIGGVEQVFGKLCRETGEFFGNSLEARFQFVRQFGTGKTEVAHFVVDDFALCGTQAGVFGAFLDRLVAGEELEILSEFSVEARDLRQHGVVGFAPRRNVIDRMQVANDAPGVREAFDAFTERPSKILPADRGVACRQRGDECARLLKEGVDGWPDVFRGYPVKTRQAGKIEQGVGGLGHGVMGSGKSMGGRSRPESANGALRLVLRLVSQFQPGQLFVGFLVLGAGASDHFGRQRRAGSGLVPVQRFQVVAYVLLVVGRRVATQLVRVGRPETRGIRRQRLVDEVQGTRAVDAEFEFGIGNDDATRQGEIGGFRIQADGRVARLRGNLGTVLARSCECCGEGGSAVDLCLFEGDVLVVIALFGLGGRGEDRFGEFGG